MSDILHIKQVHPTVFIRKSGAVLQQLVKIHLFAGKQYDAAVLEIKTDKTSGEILLGTVPEGESIHEIFMNEMEHETGVDFILKTDDEVTDHKCISWVPPKHWTVHVIQLSHHDPGYTDLPSNVLTVHDKWLDEAVTMVDETDHYPDDARFRIVVEQMWSLDHFLKNSTESRVAKMVECLRSGRIEATAMFGNMTTEICGHEELIRALYPAFNLKREYDIPVDSAEHNDITGVCWGLCRALTDAGIKLFCLGIPLYYGWSGGDLKLQSFWDEKKIFSHTGPGAFWWESPTGKRLLLWCNNSGCGGDFHTGLPGLAEQLQRLSEQNYPYSVMRCPVQGGARDNSPYLPGYAQTIKKWNEKWVYPHLICSTNAKFYKDFIKEVPPDLPVFRGELPGQDYPAGATSTAAPTAINRNNHIKLAAAEKMAAMAELTTDYRYQNEEISRAYEETLWYDEHAWGYHFPCGPAMKASEYEKAAHAYCSAAIAHEVINKAMAKIADHINLEKEGFHLVVFNSSSFPATGPVRAPLREIDNCGSTMIVVPPEEDASNEGYLRGALLGDRWHANPPLDLVEGRFELTEVLMEEKIPFQIIEVESAADTVPYAAERLGIGSGTKRYGFYELPLGLKRDLCFIAKDVPAYGYKTYRLVPAETAPEFPVNFISENDNIENEFYRITFSKNTGTIASILDKEAGREIIDPDSRFGFISLIVRTPESGMEYIMKSTGIKKGRVGPVCASLEITGEVFGHPRVNQTISLYIGVKKVYVDVRILKDPTPLLDVHLAFPFKMDHPGFRYEGVLSVMTPIEDYLPDSYSDRIAVQNWVKLADSDSSILWSSLDAPVASFSDLHPGYVSPAHRCFIDERAAHAPLVKEQLNKGWIFSDLFHNNFGTNFSVSQTGDMLFRYVISTRRGNIADSDAAAFGWQAAAPFEQIFTKRQRKGLLPVEQSLLEMDNEDIVLLTFKKAEDNHGYIMRLWNMADETSKVKVRFNFIKIGMAYMTNMVEENQSEVIVHNCNAIHINLDKGDVATIRVTVC